MEKNRQISYLRFVTKKPFKWYKTKFCAFRQFRLGRLFWFYYHEFIWKQKGTKTSSFKKGFTILIFVLRQLMHLSSQ